MITPIEPYDQVTPAEVAESDQYLAQARAAARDGAMILLTVYPTPGDICGNRGCEKPADVVLYALYGTPDQFGYFNCLDHHRVLVANIAPVYNEGGAQWW